MARLIFKFLFLLLVIRNQVIITQEKCLISSKTVCNICYFNRNASLSKQQDLLLKIISDFIGTNSFIIANPLISSLFKSYLKAISITCLLIYCYLFESKSFIISLYQFHRKFNIFQLPCMQHKIIFD